MRKSSRDSFGRTLVLGLALVSLIALGGWFVFERVGTAGPPRVAAAVSTVAGSRPIPAQVPEVRATVIEVVGLVEWAHGEQWKALSVGDELAADDSVRTSPGARVDLWVGDEASRLSIPERSEVRMGAVTRAVHTIRLARGRLDVDYRGKRDRVLRVQSGNGTVAETREARFTMLRNGAVVAVATRGGSVDLSSAGVTVQVGAGQQSLVLEGAKPLAPEPIPLEVLLKVATKASANEALCVSLTGKVRVGTEVFVEGEPTEVAQDGSFRKDVPRLEGLSQVKVVAREPGGEIREMMLACRPRVRVRPRTESVRFRWKEAP
ncbi:FecR domain-containing protein [Archangium violaceum]|uniref:FecR domain-containing protein n=1 Tax=Archangium violaceum TaxID=83451 RepID=UPI00193C26B1|nr:FecR domain-containing protein [Archangium violaceum]QRK07059.1 FecR domain-containing protein [Archangium violaceum]